MTNYNFLDRAGLKKYHDISGYSEIPIRKFKHGTLNVGTGVVEGTSNSDGVSDYLELPVDEKYSIKVNGAGTICYYCGSDFISGESFNGSVQFKLSAKHKPGVDGGDIYANRIRVSAEVRSVTYQDLPTLCYIRSLHDGTNHWLYDMTDANTSSINAISKIVYKSHISHSLTISPTIIEADQTNSTNITATKLAITLNGAAQGTTDGVTSASVTKTDGTNSSITVNDLNKGISVDLGAIKSTNSNIKYTIGYNGIDFTGTKTVAAVNPTYFGPVESAFVADTIASKSTVRALFNTSYGTNSTTSSGTGSQALKTSAAGTYKITVTDDTPYICIISPYKINASTQFADPSTGFQFYMEDLTGDVGKSLSGFNSDGSNATYYFYKSLPLKAGTYTIQIKQLHEI